MSATLVFGQVCTVVTRAHATLVVEHETPAAIVVHATAATTLTTVPIVLPMQQCCPLKRQLPSTQCGPDGLQRASHHAQSGPFLM